MVVAMVLIKELYFEAGVDGASEEAAPEASTCRRGLMTARIILERREKMCGHRPHLCN